MEEVDDDEKDEKLRNTIMEAIPERKMKVESNDEKIMENMSNEKIDENSEKTVKDEKCEKNVNDEKCEKTPAKKTKIEEKIERKDEINVLIRDESLKSLEFLKSPIKVTEMKNGTIKRPNNPKKLSDLKISPKSEKGPRSVKSELKESYLVKKCQDLVNPDENETIFSTFSVPSDRFSDIFVQGGPNLDSEGSLTLDKNQILRSSILNVKEKSRVNNVFYRSNLNTLNKNLESEGAE